jgi:hypothetical protein
MSKAICAIGLDKQWRNLLYVHHIDDAGSIREGIISGVMEILGRPISERFEWFGLRCLDRRLNYTLSLPIEHALYCLHIYTDLHITRHFAHTCSDDLTPAPDNVTIMRLKEECETLSNYMMYLMVVYPSMLPVSTAAQDLEPELLKWVSINNQREGVTKLDFLGHYTSSVLFGHEPPPPFEPEPNVPFQLEQSLKEIKEMWLRLLVYAAGKCCRDTHGSLAKEPSSSPLSGYSCCIMVLGTWQHGRSAF